MPREASWLGSTCTRTANLVAPKTFTCATPLRVEMRGAMMVSAYSSTTGKRERGGTETHEQDRLVRRVDLLNRGRRGHAGRQPLQHRGDGVLHVLRGAVDIAVQHELQRDIGLPAPAQGRHRVEAGNGRELPFERRGHRSGHGLRTRAGQRGLHLERRKVDVRQIADGKRAIARDPEQQDRHHHQGGHHRPLDE